MRSVKGSCRPRPPTSLRTADNRPATDPKRREATRSGRSCPQCRAPGRSSRPPSVAAPALRTGPHRLPVVPVPVALEEALGVVESAHRGRVLDGRHKGVVGLLHAVKVARTKAAKYSMNDIADGAYSPWGKIQTVWR